MKPLSGMWLYINLVFAIIWDSVGFVLFIIGLIPAVQAFAIAASPVLDIIAFLTDLIFCFLYQGYVKIYNVNFRLYQVKRIREMMRLSKNSGMSNNPIARNLARQTQKINQYMLDKFSNYVMNFIVNRIKYSIITMATEAPPWLGDLSPSWTIKANLHLREHRKIARELKIRNVEFENSLAKWRGSLRIRGVGKLKSRNNNRVDTKTSANNIRSFNREKLAGSRAQTVIKQQSINQGVRDSAANNIRLFRRKLPSDTGASIPRQKDINLDWKKSAAGNIASFGRQVVGSIPQSLEYEDEELRDKKLTSNNIRSIKTKVLGDISKPVQSQNNNNNKLDTIKSVASKASYMGGQLLGSIPQSLEYEDEDKLQNSKLQANNIRPVKTRVLRDISKTVSYPKDNNLDENKNFNNDKVISNNIRQLNRTSQNQSISAQTLETLPKK